MSIFGPLIQPNTNTMNKQDIDRLRAAVQSRGWAVEYLTDAQRQYVIA